MMGLEQAIELAYDNDMDLVEVSPTADPPVCRIMDYGKFLFEQNKKAHAARKKQKQVHVKEVKFRPGTEENDYQIKLGKLVCNRPCRCDGNALLHRDWSSTSAFTAPSA